MSARDRNTGVDVFRCLLVFGICAYHAFFCCGHANGYESRFWTWAVPGFAFVSGYYGIRFSVWKITKLWLLGFTCAILPYLLGGSYSEALFGYWYLSAYTVMCLMSPFVNMALRRMHETHRYSPLLGVAVVALWSWLSEFAITRDVIPFVNGFGALSFTTIFVVYVLAWCYREFNITLGKYAVPLLLVLLPLSMLLGHYTSPVTLLIVVALFSVFEKMSLPESVGRIASNIAASGFTVYLLHANWPVLKLMRDVMDVMIVDFGLPRILVLLAVAFLVFVGGVAIYWILRVPLLLQMARKKQ